MDIPRSKRIRLLACIVVFATVLLTFDALPAHAADTTITLKLSSFLPPAHPGYKTIEELCQELTEASGGSVVVKHYGAAALGPATDEYDMVMEGMADIGLTCCSFTPNRFPLALGVQLPFFSNSAVTEAKVISELMKRGFFANEFKDVIYLFPGVTTPAHIFSNKKIATIEDFKGLRMWGGELIFKEIADALGATVYRINTPDVYLSLQRGVLDAAVNSYTTAMAWKWNEVVKYAVDVSILNGWHCNFVMNKKSWSKVPEDVQLKWKGIFAKYSVKSSAVYDQVDKAMKAKWEQFPGVKVIEFPEAEKAKLVEKIIPVWQKWVDSNGKQGEEMYKAYVEIMKGLGKPVVVKLPGLYQN